jgi:hypothetical protein
MFSSGAASSFCAPLARPRSLTAAPPPSHRFKPEAPNPAQQKIVENVRNYLFVFLKLCADSRESAKRAPVRVRYSNVPEQRAPQFGLTHPLRAARPAVCFATTRQSLKALDGCEKTLNAVWKRAARKRNASGPDKLPMPAEKMMKWGFLMKHERWLAVDGFSVMVTPIPCMATRS